MAKKIVVTSGKGGVGKTTVSANLGKALANMGIRVALIDIDFGLNNLDVVMGLENKGEIKLGADADFIVTDKSGKLLHTVIAGEIIR